MKQHLTIFFNLEVPESFLHTKYNPDSLPSGFRPTPPTPPKKNIPNQAVSVDQTHDLQILNLTFSQLSYIPAWTEIPSKKKKINKIYFPSFHCT